MQIKTTQDVENLLRMYLASGAVGTALETGLFFHLVEEPLSTNDISRKFNIPYDRCKSWLALLRELGLLNYKGKKYSASALTQKVILDAYSSETWGFLTQEIREGYPMIIDLPLNISHPNSVWEAQNIVPQDYITQMKNDSKRAERFTRMLYELHHSLGRKIAKTLDLTDIKQLMDIGGGSGVISLALLEHYPDLKVVVVDIENVCTIGKEIASKTEVKNRITYHAADFIQDDLPTGFDMIIECDVGVYSEALFRKLWNSLKEGGRFVIITNTNEQGAWVTHKKSKPSFFWYLSVFSESLGVPKFKLTSLSDVKSQLYNAGFQNVSDQILEDGIIIIQAIK
jgi:ubiquinone/menaquinone biosynthesis C-methylase UbiE